jgi:hypothetical protein
VSPMTHVRYVWGRFEFSALSSSMELLSLLLFLSDFTGLPVVPF